MNKEYSKEELEEVLDDLTKGEFTDFLDKSDELEEQYEIYASECRDALNLVEVYINNMRNALNRAGKPDPIDGFRSRVKAFKSTKNKCAKRGYKCTIESIRENIKDMAGVRIVTKYSDEVTVVKDLITHIPGITIVNVEDYIAQPKPNGYSSTHLGCIVQVWDPVRGSILVPVEIQIRSRSMNLWATLEHDLKYKNENPSPEVAEIFSKFANIFQDFDREAQRLRDYSSKNNDNS